MRVAGEKSELFVVLLLALAAFGLRVAVGPHRPMHTDEAVNAHLLGDLLAGAGHRYDPADKHGPVLTYATWPLVRALGVTRLAELEEWQPRLLPTLFGAALLLLPLALADGLGGRGAALGAALWLGLAAPFVYYGAYWIHETLFVFFTLGLIAAGWCWRRTPRRRWALVGGLCLGLLLATKETAVITLAALAAGLATTTLVCRPVWPERRALGRAVGLAGAVALVVALALYTAGFTQPGALADLARAALRFTARAGGEGHEKPWFTYFAWFGAPNVRAWPWAGWTLVAACAVGRFLDPRPLRARPLMVFLAAFAAAGAVVYSAIPYKTPWLFLNVLAPVALLAGAGLALVAGRLPRPAAVVLLLGLGGALLAETRALCVRFPADPANPLAYVPTVPDAPRLQRDLEARSATLAAGLATPVQVVGAAGEVWPLPWFLRRFPHTVYSPAPPARLDAPIVLATPAVAEEVAARLGPDYAAEYRGLRPEVLILVFTRRAAAPAASPP